MDTRLFILKKERSLLSCVWHVWEAKNSIFSFNDRKEKTRIISYNIIVKHIVVIEVKCKKYPCSFLKILLSAMRAIQNSLFLESFSHASKSAKERFPL